MRQIQTAINRVYQLDLIKAIFIYIYIYILIEMIYIEVDCLNFCFYCGLILLVWFICQSSEKWNLRTVFRKIVENWLRIGSKLNFSYDE